MSAVRAPPKRTIEATRTPLQNPTSIPTPLAGSRFKSEAFGSAGVNVTIRSPRQRPSTSSVSKSPKTTPGGIRKNPLLRSAERDRIRELEAKLRKREERGKVVDIKKIEQQLDQLITGKKHENGRLERTEQKLHSTSEELQATLHEMEEMRANLTTMERRLASAERRKSQLERDNETSRREIEELKVELCESRRRSGIRRILSDKTVDNVIHKKEEIEDSVNNELHLARKEITRLGGELAELHELRDKDREEGKSLIRDLLIAVKVAENLKQEAENELGRFRDRSSDEMCSDSAVWAEIKKGRERSTKRNALLSWVQQKLSPYPSLSVTNFSSDWSDGRAFCALVHAHRPDVIERKQFTNECTDLAVELGNVLNIDGLDSKLLSSRPEWEKVMSVVFEMYKILPTKVQDSV